MRLLSRSILYHQVKAACGGDLNKVKRVVKLVGFVNSNDDFIMQPKAVNGASDLMVEVFGEIGRHARTPYVKFPDLKEPGLDLWHAFLIVRNWFDLHS